MCVSVYGVYMNVHLRAYAPARQQWGVSPDNTTRAERRFGVPNCSVEPNIEIADAQTQFEYECAHDSRRAASVGLFFWFLVE